MIKYNRKLNNTIDLKEQDARAYLKSKENKLIKPLIWALTVLIIVIGLNVFTYNSIALEVNKEELFIQELERVSEQEEIIQEDIDQVVEILVETVETVEIDTSTIPTEEGDEKMIKEFKKEIKADIFDIEKLAYAVSIAETGGFTKGYGISHTNGQGIKHGNTVFCEGVAKMAMCKFKTQKESNEAFIKIWEKWYGGFPTLKMAERWTGSDNAGDWLRIVTWAYGQKI